jgi:hypothetical protein
MRLSPSRRLPLELVATGFLFLLLFGPLVVSGAACGGTQPGRPTLPPPEYEEPSTPSVSSTTSGATPTAPAVEDR